MDQNQSALRLLDKLCKKMEEQGRIHLMIEILMLSSMAFQKLGDPQLGYVELKTAGAPLEAEILDTAYRPVRRLKVPHEDPVALPCGEYRLRLSAPHQMSATYDFAVKRRMGWSGALASWFSPRQTERILDDRRARVAYHVGLRGGQLLEPIKVESGAVGVLDLGSHADLIVSDLNTVRRIDSRTGKTVWEVKRDAGGPGMNEEQFRGDQWRLLLYDNELLYGRQAATLVQPAPDLNARL